ncbi:hypothetical protein Pan44_08920 [Caulifigura coniformis]|uniref:DUF885 domain-containing protein n=1 Tax=Caulifigura coniformis TaxID=2527983 RepID=A0A517S9S8_9PLAN|nr:DUF885 domain-containing protein [Caulifigura coniformis]QDT52879.1 hypothetical protein Pan44_08920 [Caulifigura coniformis]
MFRLPAPVLALALLATAFLGSTSMPASAADSPEDARLAKFFQNYLDLWMAQRPLEATLLGNHDFDDVLEDVSPESRKNWETLVRLTLEGLPKEVDFRKLSRGSQIDYEILKHHLERTLWVWENIRPFETDPRTYGEYITNSIFLPLTQSTLPREQNVANAAARMRYAPSIIEAAKRTIRNPPRVVLETAIRQNKGAIAFFESGVYEVSGETPGVSSFKAASAPAIAALKSYQEWLEKEALPNASGEWRLGRERFVRKLELELEGAFPADEVLAEAESEFARVQRDMYVISRQLWSQHFPDSPLPPDDQSGRAETIRKVIAKISEDHSRPETLTAETRATVDAIKDFIAKKDILRLPEPDRCQIIEMPEFQRGNSVAYLNPAPPLDPAASSMYAVSPPPSEWDDARKESYLAEYNRRMLLILSIHEAYPGHYVQLEYSNRHPSLIRRILSSGVFAEGWAVYTEQMMLDQGFHERDLGLRLVQLKFYLRTVANAILDHKLHAQNMSDDEAMKLMVDGAYQSEGEAFGKLIRAKQTSCQLSTYFVGRMAFYRLRQQIQREMGDDFHLGRYHEAVLDHGTLPVKYLPELVRERLKQPR